MEEWWRNGISQSQAAAWFDAVVVRVNAAKHGKAYNQAWQGNGICQSQAAAWWDIAARCEEPSIAKKLP